MAGVWYEGGTTGTSMAERIRVFLQADRPCASSPRHDEERSDAESADSRRSGQVSSGRMPLPDPDPFAD